jgi:hypothetical protein
MIKIGQRWRRIGSGYNTGTNPDVFIIEIVKLRGGDEVTAKVAQETRFPRFGQTIDCSGLPTTADSNEYWTLLEGQEAPCS